MAAGLQDDWGHDVHAPNLTEPWSFRGGRTSADIYMRLKSGINGTPMPSFADTAKDEDLWHVANYVVSLARQAGLGDDGGRTEGPLRPAGREGRRRRRSSAAGRSSAPMACGHCHTPVDREGRALPGLNFAGGVKMRLVVWGDVVSANLTSDNETGLGRCRRR